MTILVQGAVDLLQARRKSVDTAVDQVNVQMIIATMVHALCVEERDIPILENIKPHVHGAIVENAMHAKVPESVQNAMAQAILISSVPML